MMISLSSLSISWTKPDLAEEAREFRHPAKQDFYLRHGIGWDDVTAAFDSGRMLLYPRGALLEGIPVLLSYHAYDDYLDCVARAKRGYRQNYVRMERDLERNGVLALPAPIVLRCGPEALLFSGYRRLCLAWNHGMTPPVWLVTLPDQGAATGAV
jgi:hypothetical protein